ncbi:MAG: hypothetical protein JWM28_1817 [Chitinophagaceae bacterium]|nr:hypothetical protein [Chitinophagaceae bacterium]
MIIHSLPEFRRGRSDICIYFEKFQLARSDKRSVHLLVLVLFFSIFSFSQKSGSRLEINPFIRTDAYSKFSYQTGGITRDEVTIKGTSWGLNLSYKIPLKNNFSVKAGLGYYRYSFNKIDHLNTTFGHSDKRIIGYPSTYYLLFATNKYWYNTVSVNTALERAFIIKNNTQVIGGLNLSNHITYSQYYHIPVDYPVGPKHGRYTRNKIRYFGTSANVYFSLVQKIGNIQIGPSFIIPVYDTWKQDYVFPEEYDSGTRSKWLRGIGIGLVFSIPLNFTN